MIRGARAIADYYARIAPFIDAELTDRGDDAVWARIAEQHRGGRVLELGAGSGRVTALLARHAARVVAVDLSGAMLARARARLAGRTNVVLHRVDIRTLHLREGFELVAAANDPFCHLTRDADRSAAVDVVVRHLAPSGRFVLDALWLDADDEREAASVEGRIRRVETVWRGRPMCVLERTRCAARKGQLIRRYEYRVDGGAPIVATCTVRCWSAAELETLLGRSGLEIEAWTATPAGLLVTARRPTDSDDATARGADAGRRPGLRRPRVRRSATAPAAAAQAGGPGAPPAAARDRSRPGSRPPAAAGRR